MTYLLDTDTVIDLARGARISHPANAAQRVRSRKAREIVSKCRVLQAAGDILGVSAITVAELEFGARNGGNYPEEAGAVRKILTPFTVFAFDGTFCPVEYGLVRHRLEADGNPIGSMDLLIAAHAKALGAILVTGNTRHFKRVPGLACQTWIKSR